MELICFAVQDEKNYEDERKKNHNYFEIDQSKLI
jgi:hypothetical protein